MSRTVDGEPGVLEARLWQRLEAACSRLRLELSAELEAELRRWAKRASRDRELRRLPEQVEAALEDLAERLADLGAASEAGERSAGLEALRRALTGSPGHRSLPTWARLSATDGRAVLVETEGLPGTSKTGRPIEAAKDVFLLDIEDHFKPTGRGTVATTVAFEPPREEMPVETSVEALPPDPPRTAFALLEAPPAVVEGVELEVTVGLAEKPQPGVIGGALERPASSVGPYTLVVQLVAEGFTLRAGESSRRELPVTAEAPFPSTIFHLTARADASAIEARLLQALFSVDGQTIGAAFRAIAVVATAEQLEGKSAQPQEGVDLQVPTADSAPDLTVRILAPASAGRLHWSFETPHPGIEVPSELVETELGEDARSFARQVVDQVNLLEGKPALPELLRGIGESITDAMPPALWPLLAAVAREVGGVPTVLLLSQEPFVPWELAVLPDSLLLPSAPPHLGAQVQLGRWVLGSRKPRVPPPWEGAVTRMDIVAGVYDRVPGFRRLVEAEQEAKELQAATFLAGVERKAVDATSEAVLAAFREQERPAHLLHFAVHGVYDPNGLEDGLMLIDRQTLSPLVVKGSQLAGTPFVYLNACQVGSGNRVLGSPAGLAEAFLHAGATAVVAPLWSIQDALARKISLEFYQRVAAGEAPAAILRQARERFGEVGADGRLSATFLAYQFFGHPRFRLALADQP